MAWIQNIFAELLVFENLIPEKNDSHELGLLTIITVVIWLLFSVNIHQKKQKKKEKKII